MSVLLFRLTNVSEDEAENIRNLLTNKNIDYYETPPGNWGISMPAIWLNDDDQFDKAKRLIDEYQTELLIKNKGGSGQSKNIVNELLSNPIQFVLYIAFAVLILYCSIKPFLNFGR